MRVAMYYNNKDIRIEEMSIPQIVYGELLVKVMACGICGSDVMEWYRTKSAPRVLGHEATGEVVEVGEGVERYKIGDRVFVSHHVPCNTCSYCLSGHHTVCNTLRTTNFYPGGFAEYVRVPKINVDRGVFLLPREITFEEGTFIEPLGCVLRAQKKAGIQPGNTVLVIGCGVTGLLHIQLAKVFGASRIFASDINESRLKAAQKFGADLAINANENIKEKIRKLNDGKLPDRVIVCTGALSAINQVIHLIDRCGTVIFFAPAEPGANITIPFNDMWFDGVSLTTSYAASPYDLATAIELIRSQRVNVKDMITHRLSLAETGSGFKLVADAKDSIKVIIEPQR